MLIEYISFQETGYFSKFICDYVNQENVLSSLYNRFPSLENFDAQIQEKQASFNIENRTILSEALTKQYEGLKVSNKTQFHIDVLKDENTFTVTTGHQLNLFTGPLYFLYKIVSTINLTKQLKQTYPNYNFVPVYWMATEDHDFEEINYFNFRGKKIRWNRPSSGAVGELDTNGLRDVFEVFAKEIGAGVNAELLKSLFKNAYIKHDNLADATRFLANELFGEHGLVIVDANTKTLKNLFAPYMESELINQHSFNNVVATNSQIESISTDYKIQVNPREINLFYLTEGLRERIVFEDTIFRVLNTNLEWTQEELKKELHSFPERFSPNVILRPLYQEVILPNLCYIGGGGELAYWLQLKSNFESHEVVFPMLLLRNSVLIKTEKQSAKLEKLHISKSDIFLKRDTFINRKVREISNINIDFSEQKELLKKQFEDLYKLAERTDKSFLGAVKSQEVKQIKGLEHLEKRLLKAQKKKLSDHVIRMTDLQNALFPNHSLQERFLNFSELYLEYGDELIQHLLQNLEPLKMEFSILKI